MTGKSRAGLVIPVALWGAKEPSNRIVQVVNLNKGQTIVTGTSDGQLVQWKVDESLNWIQPQVMLLAHSTAITCLAPALNGAACSRYVSCSEDGQICLWDSRDGKIVESAVQQYVHREILPHSFVSADGHQHARLFCVGDYSEVVVLDALDLNIVCFLRSRMEPDWLNAMTLVHSNDKLLAITLSGVIKMWALQDVEKRDATSVVYEDEAKPLGIKYVRAICCSKLNTRMMLLIAANSWQILDPSSLHQLIVSQCAIEAVNGTIIDIDRVAIGFADSTIVLFQLPRIRLCGKQARDRFGEKPVPLGNIEHPFVFALLRGINPSPNNFSDGKVKFFFDCRSNGDSRVAYRADDKGHLGVWTIPKNFDALVDEFIRVRKPTVYDCSTKQNLAEVWARLAPKPPSMIGMEGRVVTATIYIGSQGKLLLGRDDGSILMAYACHAIAAQLFEQSAQGKRTARPLSLTDLAEVEQRVLEGHSAAVNCFLYPFQEDERYDPEVFLSGGLDFAVIVWNLNTGSKLHRFCSQGGPILRMLCPPGNCTPRLVHCICAIAGDNSAALLSLKENKCILLASRQQCPILEVKWRPLDDFMLLRCEDNSVYVWQMETGNLDRIVGGILSADVMEACDEQVGVTEVEDRAGASSAVRMLRALKHKNMDAVKSLVANSEARREGGGPGSSLLPSPMEVIQLKKCSNEAHLLLFNVDALIHGLQATDLEQAGLGGGGLESGAEQRPSFSSLIARKADSASQGHLPLHPALTNAQPAQKPPSAGCAAQRWQLETNLYMDTAHLLMSLLHGWNLDPQLDEECLTRLRLKRPRTPLCFGTISKKGFVSLAMPFCTGKNAALNDLSFRNFSQSVRWKEDPQLTTLHLLALVSVSNTLMSLKSRVLSAPQRRPLLRRVPSAKSTDSAGSDADAPLVRQAWSRVASMHCVQISELVRPADSYAAPQIDLLARRWHDSCPEVRDAAQAILIRELTRIGAEGRKALLDEWSPYLPTLLDPSISIFGYRDAANGHNVPSAPLNNYVVPHADKPQGAATEEEPRRKVPPPRPAPPIPPRKGAVELPSRPDQTPDSGHATSTSSVCEQAAQPGPHPGPAHADPPGGLHQVRRNQATAVILLGVFGAEFPKELESHCDLTRAVSHALVELLVLEETSLLPLHSPLRRAAVDLIGRGFAVWQPHIDLSRVILGMLELTSLEDSPQRCGPVSAEADACRTARHALSLIASCRAQALISALAMEVARYNAATQHQTVQHAVSSPLWRARNEVLRLIEQLTDRHHADVADMIIPVGDILVHCLDVNQLKQSTLAEVFPPIAKFYMVGYCAATRRVAFGGKTGSVVVHDLKASKAQTVQAHKNGVTAVAFSQDGKYMASYSAQEAKIAFWQTQQTFLGMGQSQMRCVKTLPAPSEFPVLSPGGSYQPFRARLVWINAKSLTLMLPNGKENRFSV